MYLADALRMLVGGRRGRGQPEPLEAPREPRDPSAPNPPRSPRNVWVLGATSLVTDVSSEMVAAALPLYLVYALELSPLALGFVDGLVQGTSGAARLVTAVVADRLRRLKEVALAGYALSAACKLGLVAAGGAVPQLGAALVLDRVGKGVRTAPRDALLSRSVEPRDLGRAFGVHRALDTIGAVLGPLVAMAVLALAPGRFDVLFVVSACVGVAGVALFAGFVDPLRRPQREGSTASAEPILPVGEAPGLGARAAVATLFAPWRSRAFRSIALVAIGFAATTVSEALVYVAVQRQTGFDPRALPLAWVWAALWFALLAAPVGRLADRAGRGRVLLGGYGLVAVAYAIAAAAPPHAVAAAIAIALLGASAAATDGVLVAAAAPTIPEAARTTGLAALGTAMAGARFVSSIAFGALWSSVGLAYAFATFVAGLAVVTALAWRPLRRIDDAA